MEIIRRERIRERFGKAVATYDRHAEAQRRICARLMELLERYTDLVFPRMLEIGCGSGYLTRLLRERCQIEEWTLNDLCAEWLPALKVSLPGLDFRFIAGDAERTGFHGPFDLIASASTLQWMTNLPAFLRELSTRLSERGVLLFNTFAPDNLPEIRALTGEGLPYPASGQIRKWLSEDFNVIREEEERITLTFKTPMEVLRHLKYTGVTANFNGVWTKGKQERFLTEYPRFFPSDKENGVTLTYHPIYYLAFKK